MAEKPEQVVFQIINDEMNMYINDSLIEQIWYDLQGQVDHKQIYQVALQEAVKFRDVAIRNFVSNFVRRRTYKRLKSMLNEGDFMAH